MHLLNHHPPLLPTGALNAQLAEYLSLSNLKKKIKKSCLQNYKKDEQNVLPNSTTKNSNQRKAHCYIHYLIYFFASDSLAKLGNFLSIFWVCFWYFSDLYPRLWISYCCCCNICDAPKDYHQQCQNNPQSLIDNHQSKVIFFKYIYCST